MSPEKKLGGVNTGALGVDPVKFAETFLFRHFF
jgi:hypothetical protein